MSRFVTPAMKLRTLRDKASAIVTSATAEGRDLTVDEANEVNKISAQGTVLKHEIENDKQYSHNPNYAHSDADGGIEMWMSSDGTEVPVLKPSQKLAGLSGGNPRALSMGRAIRSMVTGSWKNAEAEAECLGSFPGSAGGHLVPDELSNIVIDAARSKSVLMQAGC